MRLLMWLGLAVLVYLAVRKSFRSNQVASKTEQVDENAWGDNTFPQSASSKRVEAMLNCAYCQVYFPASEAVARGSHQYCCAEHAEAASKSGSDSGSDSAR